MVRDFHIFSFRQIAEVQHRYRLDRLEKDAKDQSMYQGSSLCMVFTVLSSDAAQKPEGDQRTRESVIRSHTR